MPRLSLLIIFIFISVSAVAQIRLTKLTIEKNERFVIQESDILVVDTLIMRDSSQIVLNAQKKDNFIHAKVAIIGNNCLISGNGKSGKSGNDGPPAIDQAGPCILGRNGNNGAPGGPGKQGNNLFFYLTDLNLNGTLTINLNGGEGGDGGNGSRGGGGGPGTRVCPGGNGGVGGNGGHGGNGGDAGNLTIQCKNCPALRSMVNTSIIVKIYGGFSGFGGEGGFGGLAGLGPLSDGVNGKKGVSGKDGEEGKDGAINFLNN